MRVTGGSARGVPLRSPTAPGVRPTTDRVRAALFSILAGYGVEDAVVADLYAGTGSLGIEALSRGAAHADFVEADRRQVAVIRANLTAVKVASRARVLQAKVEDALPRLGKRYDFLLMDPPYTQPFPVAVVTRVGDLGLLQEGGTVVAGHASRVEAPEVCGRMVRTQDRRYGDASLAFYEMSPAEAAA
ncbi:MAG: 16S rRNA (guanine(966)-N(2))-methyltransferase RsmD [Dehalococcoidia bacterium]